jgi:hypothetical protein
VLPLASLTGAIPLKLCRFPGRGIAIAVSSQGDHQTGARAAPAPGRDWKMCLLGCLLGDARFQLPGWRSTAIRTQAARLWGRIQQGGRGWLQWPPNLGEAFGNL